MTYSIEGLMRDYGNDVLRTAYAYVKDKYAAEDIFQETFIKAYRNLEGFREESGVKTWLIRITINTCKDYLKSAYNKRVVPMLDFEEDSLVADDEFEKVEIQDRNEMIKKVVMGLPDNYREVIICVYYREMSVADTAELLGIAEGTVKSRLARAREQLKNKLEGRL